MHWGDTVKAKVAEFGPLVLGIDPDPIHVPNALMEDSERFLQRYVEALLDGADGRIAFVKFQSAHFEAYGSAGIASLARGIAMAKERNFATILDAKRGDIGSTSEAYARAYLTPGHCDLEVDCMTINPFLGPETLEPFVDRARDFGKGLFILVKTSNPGSGWLQDKEVEGKRVSHRVAEALAGWSDETKGSTDVSAIGAVVGATYPSEALELRRILPNSIFLCPGLGAQGADPKAITATATGTGPVLVPASRGIAAADDSRMSIESYVQLVRQRIDEFNRELTP